jgi:hypothetical protein
MWQLATFVNHVSIGPGYPGSSCPNTNQMKILILITILVILRHHGKKNKLHGIRMQSFKHYAYLFLCDFLTMICSKFLIFGCWWLRYNLHTVKCYHFKYSIAWVCISLYTPYILPDLDMMTPWAQTEPSYSFLVLISQATDPLIPNTIQSFWPFLKVHINRIMHYRLFRVWLLLQVFILLLI